MRPAMASARSFAPTPAGNVPEQRTRIVSGTRIHNCPVAIAAAMSVEPTPVVNAAKAPPVQLCESDPIAKSPGAICPRSGSTTWLMPSPISYNRTPWAFAKSRNLLCAAADIALGLGWWSRNKIYLDASHTRSVPMPVNRSMASGRLPSCEYAKSSDATTMSPACASCPLFADNIFSAIVLPIAISPVWTMLGG